MNLSERSNQKELLDGESIAFADIQQNMKELDVINKWLGGHRITIDGFRTLAGNKTKVSVCEIGCGGGDNLLAIDNWCRRKNISLLMTGIDIKHECVDFAKSRNELNGVEFITSDYRDVRFKKKPDVIFSSLFCHHFTTEELVKQLIWMKEHANFGFFLNDLQRSVGAYYSIKVLTRLFSKSYLVKNDAPLSVARGFTHSELTKICREACMSTATIEWKWAFRYLVTFCHDQPDTI